MDTIIETQQNSLRVVVKIGLLLGLDLNDGVEEVLVGDEAALPPEGDHARLYTYSLALGAVKVIRTPNKKFKDHSQNTDPLILLVNFQLNSG